jgi:rubrerythrin
MHVLPKMDTSFDPDDDLSTAFGPETLAERDMVPAAYQNASSSNTDLAVEVIGGGRFLKVDQSANLRANSLTSKIWQHGFEYRSLKNGLRDKYWRCRHCKAKKLFKITDAGNTNTSYAIRYLKRKHPVSFRHNKDQEE